MNKRSMLNMIGFIFISLFIALLLGYVIFTGSNVQ